MKHSSRWPLISVLAALTFGCASEPPAVQFPWPPPPASAEMEVPSKWLPPAGEATLSQVAESLVHALRSAGYGSWSFSPLVSIPDGFALVTQMEQIKRDGTPSPAPNRFSTRLPAIGGLTWIEFIRALVGRHPGHYRVIVFVVTDRTWTRDAAPVTGNDAQGWLRAGSSRLPDDIGHHPYGPEHATTVLVYEFQKYSDDAEPAFVDRSEAAGKTHLRRAGILDPLSGLD